MVGTSAGDTMVCLLPESLSLGALAEKDWMGLLVSCWMALSAWAASWLGKRDTVIGQVKGLG